MEFLYPFISTLYFFSRRCTCFFQADPLWVNSTLILLNIGLLWGRLGRVFVDKFSLTIIVLLGCYLISGFIPRMAANELVPSIEFSVRSIQLFLSVVLCVGVVVSCTQNDLFRNSFDISSASRHCFVFSSIFGAIYWLFFPEQVGGTSAYGSVFSGFGSGNFFVFLGITLLLSLVQVSTKKIDYWFMVGLGFYLFLVASNPLRISFYFIFMASSIIIFYRFSLPFGFFLLLLLGFLVFPLGLISMEDKYLKYMISKTNSESRQIFFNDLFVFLGDLSFWGSGFGVDDPWKAQFGYTPLDIHSFFIIFLESGFFGLFCWVVIYILFLVRFLKIFKERRSDSVGYFWMAPGLVILNVPNVGLVGQVSVIEHIIFWYLVGVFASRFCPSSKGLL